MMRWRVHHFLVEGPLDWIDVGVSKSADVDEKDGWIGGLVSLVSAFHSNWSGLWSGGGGRVIVNTTKDGSDIIFYLLFKRRRVC